MKSLSHFVQFSKKETKQNTSTLPQLSLLSSIETTQKNDQQEFLTLKDLYAKKKFL